MADEEPDAPSEYEPFQKVAVNGNVVGELRVKPGALLSDIEDEAMSAIVTAQFAEVARDGEIDIEMLKKYDPEIQIWMDREGDDEPSWSSARNISETRFLEVCEDL
ncbi:MAG: hypothetical protein ABEJ60_04360 [Halodesulfurarchaeum sp.]